MKKFLPKLILLVVFPFGLIAQNSTEVDSLYAFYQKAHQDTSKVQVLLKLSQAYPEKQRVKGLGFSREALELSTRINYYPGICKAEMQIADYYFDQLNYPESIKHYLNAASNAEKSGLFKDEGQIYNAIGIIYSNQGKNDLSLKYFLKVAKIAQDHKDDKRLAIAYNNIGISYKDLGRLKEANNYYQKAFDYFTKSKFTRGIASASNNLGILAHMEKRDKEAYEYYQKSIDCFYKLKDTGSASGIYTNIGELYNDNKEYKKALEYYKKGLEYAEHYSVNNFRGDAYEGLSEVYANLGDYKQALFFLNKHIKLKDTITNEEGMRQVQEMERRLDNEKQEKEIEMLKQGQEIQRLKVETQDKELQLNRLVLYVVLVAFLFVLIMAFYIYKSRARIKRTNIELAITKKEIQDSINYAKNIQEAMLPEVGLLGNYFPEGFGLFKPKDVVSGDFYWFNELEGKLYFAVADCTGHGVPGGFMSMIGIDKLNQAIVDKKISEVGDILAHLNVNIRKALRQNNEGSTTKDGMDIGLCSFDKRTNELCYAGANRPLWILSDCEMRELRPTKASIAGYTNDDQGFEEHRIRLKSGDCLYLFSDGYADQFGGPEKKKFMTKRLRQTFIELHTKPMREQELMLLKTFETWRGELAQVDDVLVLGLRVG